MIQRMKKCTAPDVVYSVREKDIRPTEDVDRERDGVRSDEK